MAAKTVTKDLSGLGSIIKNYSTSSEGGFLSRIKTIVFYDVIDASLNEMYETLLNSIGKIEVNTVVNGANGETMSLDDLLTQLELLKRRVDKLYTFHYDFNMGVEGAVDLQIGESFDGKFTYRWGDFMLTPSSYIKGISDWTVSGDPSLKEYLDDADENIIKFSIPNIESLGGSTSHANPFGNNLKSDNKASVTFTSLLYTDPDTDDLTPIASSVRLTWSVPKLYGMLSTIPTNAEMETLLQSWVSDNSHYRNSMNYQGTYIFECPSGENMSVYPVFAIPKDEMDIPWDIFRERIVVEGWSNNRWEHPENGICTVNVNGIPKEYFWFYFNGPQSDTNLEVTLR
jgi:hypothetical protein